MGQETMGRRDLLRWGPLAGVAACAGAGEARADTAPPVTAASLLEMLKNLGFEPDVLKSTTGDPFYRFRWMQDTYTFVLEASLSKDASIIWVIVRLGIITDVAKAPVDALLKLLSENEKIGPAHFSVNETNHQIFLNYPLYNVDVSPARMRRVLDSLTATVRRTEPLWNTKNWEAAK